MNFGTLGLQAKIAFFVLGITNSVYKLSIDRELDDAVHADHVVNVPLSPTLATVLEGLAPTTPGVVRGRFEATRSEEFAMNISNGWRCFAFFGPEFNPVEF
jgi:hypothetical protein